MKEVKPEGIIIPLCTPMREDESIHIGELRNHVERLLAGGAHGLFCFGTNGEGYILDGKEKELILQTVIEQAAGRVPVYAGTGCISTKETIRQSRMAMELGADAISIITPSFAKASQEELYQHYRAVARAVELPIVLYNIPARTGNALSSETVERLSRIENIAGAKDSSGDWDNIKAYMDRTRGSGFAVLSGNDSLILDTLLYGGAGAVSGCANVYPHTLCQIYEAYKKGDMENARRWQDSIASFRSVFQYGNPNTIVKLAVNLLGHPVGPCRAPFNQLSPEGMERLSAVLQENKEIGLR